MRVNKCRYEVSWAPPFMLQHSPKWLSQAYWVSFSCSVQLCLTNKIMGSISGIDSLWNCTFLSLFSRAFPLSLSVRESDDAPSFIIKALRFSISTLTPSCHRSMSTSGLNSSKLLNNSRYRENLKSGGITGDPDVPRVRAVIVVIHIN